MLTNTTICAIATPSGNGAIALIRLSGDEALDIVASIFYGKKRLHEKQSHTLSFGEIRHGDEVIDEVLVAIFKAPNSYTGEEMVEISCHASPYIQQQILRLLLNKGATLAQAGEFTQRAYLNGKLDLSQAEAVADIINSQSAAAHKVAIQQMRGGYSEALRNLREQLLLFVSLIELELDFGEEDVEFADRSQLNSLATELHKTITSLTQSFQLGNAMKKGIPVAIVGSPNVGKSTLLNSLLGEEKAIVSDIAGTTRDVVEDTIIINGVTFRFIDTAGIRQTTDTVEILGIQRTWQQIDNADLILFMTDATEEAQTNIKTLQELQSRIANTNKRLLLLINKTDKKQADKTIFTPYISTENIISISAKEGTNTETVLKKLEQFYGEMQSGNYDIIVSNMRHYELLSKANTAISRVLDGLSNAIPTDFLSQDIRECMHYLGEITGEITTDEVLGNIFKNFCIGK